MSAILTREEIEAKWPMDEKDLGWLRCGACHRDSHPQHHPHNHHENCIRVYALAVAAEVLRLRAEQARLQADIVTLDRIYNRDGVSQENAREIERIFDRHVTPEDR